MSIADYGDTVEPKCSGREAHEWESDGMVIDTNPQLRSAWCRQCDVVRHEWGRGKDAAFPTRYGHIEKEPEVAPVPVKRVVAASGNMCSTTKLYTGWDRRS